MTLEGARLLELHNSVSVASGMSLQLLTGTTTGWKMKRRPNSACMAIFQTSAASAMDTAASAARIRFEDNNNNNGYLE